MLERIKGRKKILEALNECPTSRRRRRQERKRAKRQEKLA